MAGTTKSGRAVARHANSKTAACSGGPSATPPPPSPSPSPSERPTAAATLSVAYPSDPVLVRSTEAATLRALLDAPTPACVYVCGTPGVGKSITLSALLRETSAGPHNPAAVCWLSCAALPSAAHLPRAVLAALSPTDPSPSAAAAAPTPADPWAAVDVLAVSPGPRLVLVLDELDLLPSVAAARAHPAAAAVLLPKLFGWARRPRSRLSVIGVSNALTLPQTLSRSRFVAAAGVAAAPPDLVVFAPYTAAQLITLVRTRLADAAAPDAPPRPPPSPPNTLDTNPHAINTKSPSNSANMVGNCLNQQTNSLQDAPLGTAAITLAAKRIAASSGDARAMLDVCREAVRQLETLDSPVACPARAVTAVRCVASILARAGGASAAVDTIRALPLQQQLVLCAVARAEQRLTDTEVSATHVKTLSMVSLYDAFRKMLTKIGMQSTILDFKEFADVCCDILAGTHGLVHVVDAKKQSSHSSRTKSARLMPVYQRVCKVSKLGPTRFGQSHVSLRTKLVRLKVPVADVQAGVADRSLLPLIIGKET